GDARCLAERTVPGYRWTTAAEPLPRLERDASIERRLAQRRRQYGDLIAGPRRSCDRGKRIERPCLRAIASCRRAGADEQGLRVCDAAQGQERNREPRDEHAPVVAGILLHG